MFFITKKINSLAKTIAGSEMHTNESFELEILEWVKSEEHKMRFYKNIHYIYESIEQVNIAIQIAKSDKTRSKWEDALITAKTAEHLKQNYINMKINLLITRDINILLGTGLMVIMLDACKMTSEAFSMFMVYALSSMLAIKALAVKISPYLEDDCNLITNTLKAAREAGFKFPENQFTSNPRSVRPEEAQTRSSSLCA